MGDFVDALFDPAFPFLRNALLVALIASFPLGAAGSFVVVRRITYLAAAVAHSALGGVGFALYASAVLGWEWVTPTLGALAAALLTALLLGWIQKRAAEREDTLIGAVWAIGMATGLLFIARTPGFVDPMSYLFGNILILSTFDIWLSLGLAVLVCGIVARNYQPLLAIAFDEDFARTRGLRVSRYNYLLLLVTSLTVVLAASLVGVILVIALLTLPPAIASRFTNTLSRMIGIAIVIGILLTTVGLSLSFQLDLPAGPVIGAFSGVAYVGALLSSRRR